MFLEGREVISSVKNHYGKMEGEGGGVSYTVTTVI